MSYLDNSVTTVDAILTKRGREKFAQGDFNITKFSLSDDEIDYRLYDITNPSGSDYYAVALENLPLLEAISDDTILMKNKLITLTKPQTTIPKITVNSTTWIVGINAVSQDIVIGPSNINTTYGYTVTNFNYDKFELVPIVPTGQTAPVNASNIIPTSGNVQVIVCRAFKIMGKSLTSTGVVNVEGNEAGGSIALNVIINKGESTTSNS